MACSDENMWLFLTYVFFNFFVDFDFLHLKALLHQLEATGVRELSHIWVSSYLKYIC